MSWVDGILNGNTIRIPRREGDKLPELGDSIALIQDIDNRSVISSAIVTGFWRWSENPYVEVEVMSYYKTGHKVNDGHVLVKTICRR